MVVAASTEKGPLTEGPPTWKRQNKLQCSSQLLMQSICIHLFKNQGLCAILFHTLQLQKT